MFLAAGILSLIWAFTHIVVGGREVERPISQSDFAPSIRETAVLVWHMVSFVLLFLTGLLLWAAWGGGMQVAFAAFILSLGLAVTGIATQVARRQPFGVLPQGWLFVPVAALTGLGMWT